MKKIKLLSTTIILSSMFCINAFAGEWKLENAGWKYQKDNGSYVENSWEKVNEKWYYFNERGYMLSNTVTPDGYNVNGSGEWVQLDKTNEKPNYIFDSQEKWVDKGRIPEGEYVYYPNGQIGDVIVKGSYSSMSNFNYIKLYKGDIINPGSYIPVADSGLLDITKEGVFLVGKDVKAGTYTVNRLDPNNTRATCTVFASIPSSKDESTSQYNMDQDLFVFGKPKTVTVKDGQYIQINGCSADFIRP